MPKPIDLTGMRFGRFTVKQRVENNKDGRTMWLCVCDCGNERIVAGKSLRNGHTQSCGCLRKEGSHTTHGGRYDRLYKVFANMNNRCYNKSAEDYKYYGGRGIKICAAWRHNYPAFKEWALANGYDEEAAFGECTIDRIDIDGDYAPSNCRWVNMKIQSNNRRNVKNKR